MPRRAREKRKRNIKNVRSIRQIVRLTGFILFSIKNGEQYKTNFLGRGRLKRPTWLPMLNSRNWGLDRWY